MDKLILDQVKNNRLYSIWDQVPVTYYQKGTRRNIFQKIWHGKKIRLAQELLEREKFKNLLDVGCASGYMLAELAKRFPQVKYYGVDVYDKAVFYAQKRYPNINFLVASAQKLPFRDDFFDQVICYETMEHVEDPLATLKEIKRVLSQDGTAFIAMDSGSWLFRLVWFVWEKTAGRVWQGAHLHPFHHEELGEMIRRSGFSIKDKIFSHWGMEVVYIVKK